MLKLTKTEANQYRAAALGRLACTLIGTGAALGVQAIYNHVLPAGSEPSLYVITGGLLIACGIEFILKLLNTKLNNNASLEFDKRAPFGLFKHSLYMSSKLSSSRAVILAGQTDAVRDYQGVAITTAVIDTTSISICLMVLALISIPAALITVIALGLNLTYNWIVTQNKINAASKESAAATINRQRLTVEVAQGLDDIKACNAEQEVERLMKDAINISATATDKIKWWSDLGLAITGTCQTFTQRLVMFVTALAVIYDGMTTGGMVAASIIGGMAAAPIAALAASGIKIGRGRAAIDMLSAITTAPIERQDGFAPAPETVELSVEFQGVRAFLGADCPRAALDGVTVRIEPGEVVAVVAPTGAGKTTFGRCIDGSVQVGTDKRDEGQVLVGGVPATAYQAAALREIVVRNPQDPMMMSGTVRFNVTFGKMYPDDKIMESLRIAGADFVVKHPAGLEMQIIERGLNLSGGQRRQIGLARAVLRMLTCSGRIYVLDEPTAHQDPASILSFRERVKPLLSGNTVIIITHGQELLPLCSRGIVMNDGKITGIGNVIISKGDSK